VTEVLPFETKVQYERKASISLWN